jgi:hypothetical protein
MFNRRKHPRPTPTGPVDAITIPGTFGFLSLGTRRDRPTVHEPFNTVFLVSATPEAQTQPQAAYRTEAEARHHTDYLRTV